MIDSAGFAVRAVALQAWYHGANPGLDVAIELGGSGAIGAFLSTALVGAILIAIAPDYTGRVTERVQADPVGSVVYGLLCLVALVGLIVLLVVSIVGILVVVPLALIAYLVWAAGSAVAFLAIGERLLDDEGQFAPLLVGALINGALALTIAGGLVSFGVGAAGFGALLRDWLGREDAQQE